VHVGTCARNFTQCRRLESTVTMSLVEKPAIPPRNSGVVELFIRKVASFFTFVRSTISDDPPSRRRCWLRHKENGPVP
jgi:hypothetical protein